MRPRLFVGSSFVLLAAALIGFAAFSQGTASKAAQGAAQGAAQPAAPAGDATQNIPGNAQGSSIGSVSGLPVPRYVSLKSDRVNLREGPSKDHRVSWLFQRAGLPVEITAEFETWRRIRDSEGTEGWVLHSLLSGRRTALIAPWEKGKTFDLRDSADDKAAVVARLQAGVIVSIRSCTGSWCRVTVRDSAGYIRQERLWGVYPHEKID